MKVLVVDDSPLVRKRVKRLILEVPTVETVSEAKGRSGAMRSLRKVEHDVMVVDIEIPNGDAIGLLADVKKQQKPPLVIVLSKLSGPEYRKKCADIGADFFFDKSTEFERVADVLRKCGAR